MEVVLPRLEDNLRLPVEHFPALYQCVIFRNWGMVPAANIAAVIETDEKTVRQCAADLGLDPQLPAQDEWMQMGFITIIRANWHILDYDAICKLLGWTPEQLSFTLREDDFLEVKMGRMKPSVGNFRYRPLTDAEISRTAEICSIVQASQNSLPPITVKPFDFEYLFSQKTGTPCALENPRFRERFVYSYCALFGDTFLDRKLIDASFPDSLLRAYQNAGITGVWTHIVLYKMVEFPFDPQQSEGYKIRQSGMRYLTEKLARYGLKLYVYFNEPRAMPKSFFEQYPELKGTNFREYAHLCVRTEPVQKYLRDGVTKLLQAVPGLGGLFTITASENHTNCHSHPNDVDCPRCSKYRPADSYALVIRLIWEGIQNAGSNAELLVWNWGWPPECMPEVVARLPKGVSVMSVSERGVEKDFCGTVTNVRDYSISIVGPGEYAKQTWRCAHNAGNRAIAKMQVNNTWEMASVPYIPAFDKVWQHINRLCETPGAEPDGLMLSWSLGGYPSPVLELLKGAYDRNGKLPDQPDDLYADLFPDAEKTLLTQAIHRFSDAFDAFPFQLGTLYHGPQLVAPANLLYRNPTGFTATMVCFAYDDLESWRSVFPLDTFLHQLKLLSDGWDQGMKLLQEATAGRQLSAQTKELLDCAQVCANHFRSIYLQSRWNMLRNCENAAEKAECRQILKEEEILALKTAAVCAHNPAIAYESSNHYFYNRNLLLEKVINCRNLAKLYE